MSALKNLDDLVSIVLVGNFNPAIFQPTWLASKGLIRESEATSASIEVIHPEIAQFRAGWLHLAVTTTKFVASTSDPAHRAPLRDLVMGIFELLDQTPTSCIREDWDRVIDEAQAAIETLVGHVNDRKGQP